VDSKTLAGWLGYGAHGQPAGHIWWGRGGLAPFLDLALSPKCIEVALGKEGLGDRAIWVLVGED